MELIIEKILNDLGNGMAKIIECNKDIDSKSFLFKNVKNRIKEKINNCLFFEFNNDSLSKKDILKELEKIEKIIKDNKAVILVDDLFSYYAPEAIINLFFGNNNIDLIFTSNIEISYKLKSKETIVRGRYNSYFLEPMIFYEEINKSVLHTKALENYKYQKEAKEIYKYLLNHAGEHLSYHKIYESLKIKKNINFYINVIEYMSKSKMIYFLEIKNIKEFKKKTYGFIVYPTFISDLELSSLSSDKKFIANKEATVVSKLVSRGFNVYAATSYYAAYVNNVYVTRNIYNAGFLIEYYDKKALIKIYFDNDESIERFIKLKTKIPQIIIVLSNMNLKIDDNEIAYYGLENFLKDGDKFCINYHCIPTRYTKID